MVNRFSEQRRKRNVSIEELSAATGISIEELEQIESEDFVVEEMSSFKAADIAVALNCMISDLIYRD